jgi:hypothetical protein
MAAGWAGLGRWKAAWSRSRWDLALLHLSLLALLVGWASLGVPAADLTERLRLLLACWGSLGILPWLSLAAALPAPLGRVTRVVPFLATFAGIPWLVASIELSQEQDRPLLWNEIVFRVTDAPSRPFLIETLTSRRMLAFVVSFAILTAALRWLALKVPRRVAIGCVAAALYAGLVGNLLHGINGPDDALARTLCAPWTFRSRYLTVSPQDGEPIIEADLDGAKAVRHDFPSWSFAPGPDPALAPLAGRYPGRNVVLILLESHRLCGVPPYSEGSSGCRPLSPLLGQLAARGLFFTNYVSAGFNTFSAQFSVATGLPALPFMKGAGVRGAHSLAALGRWPDLRAAGYRCEWLQATPVTFDRWDAYLQAAGISGWIDRSEMAGLAHDGWSSYGMPDEQLYELAWHRYQQHAAQGVAYFLSVLTVSNHPPFRIPPRPELAGLTGHEAGMRYADLCLQAFVERLLSLPQERRPIVFITADHSNKVGLGVTPPLGPYNLESIRLPGVLLTPDGAGAGSTSAGVFSHQDLLDLLYVLVTPKEPAGKRKFLDYHRIGTSIDTDLESSIFLGDAFLFARTGAAFNIRGRWQLEPGVSQETHRRLEAARRGVAAALDRIWKRSCPAPGRC